MTVIPILNVREVPTQFANGYNLAIHNQSYGVDFYQAYRWHPVPAHWRTEIVVVKDGEPFYLTPPPQYSKHSIEDPRFFEFNGGLYLSLTIARSRVSGQSVDPCVVGFGKLCVADGTAFLQNWIEPKHPDNVWTKRSKNLVFWEHNGMIVFTWATNPAHVVHLLDANGKITTGWRTDAPKCPFGKYRGGTQSFPFGADRIRFCHAVQVNKEAVQFWGYSLAAMVFQSEPPFRILAVSQQPILTGNELYKPDCPHWKPRICIPYGAVKLTDGWRVSLGLNDCQCATVDLTEGDLNL